ncbi:zinc finger, C2H2 type [Dictyocaulus viviparus]|uniref:Zinc finger, C2H2 type n=1 Tax=Dictyocaulus viviparus TaxID=29172 RepID=A0A0D8XA58_DICVI|nr:zinc finger, C2H2 type [Dictyocaulus viviparus]
MEGPPLMCRQSVDDEDAQGIAYGVNDTGGSSFSRTLLEPNVHDVMSMELAHHDMGGYLDPRSFGGGSLGFDDYSGSSSLYDVNTSFGDEVSSEQKCLFSNDSAPFAQVSSNTHIKLGGRTEHHVSSITSNKYDSTIRHEQSRNVPTYPVKTANPSTCTQYAPVRTLINSSMKSHGSTSTRRTTSRNTQKKEAIDPKRVEDEVARNVSQILSATKQQRLAMEAQQRTGAVAPQQPRIVYACPDCHKTVTSARNLQSTDEQNCGEWSRSNSYSAPQSVSSQHERCINEPAEQLGTLDPTSISCRLEDACIHPLSLDLDEPRALSSRGSTSSASTGTHSSGAPFVCEACKKSVSSLRSLKRHHTTCKQYIAENGPPPESDHPSSKKRSYSSLNGDLHTLAVVNPSISGIAKPSRCLLTQHTRHVVTMTSKRDHRQLHPRMKAPQLPVVTSSSCRCSLFDCDCTPSTSPDQFVSWQFSRSDGIDSSVTKSIQHQKWQSVEIAARERMIIDRSYAAALAASQKAQQQTSQQSVMTARVNSENSGTFVIVQDQGIVGERPWITVGEHLRAQHMQQKVLEAQNLQNQGTTVSSAVLISDHCEADEVSKLAINSEVDFEEKSHDDNLGTEEEKRKESPQTVESNSSISSFKCTNIISRLPMSIQPSTVMRCSSSVEQKLILDVKSSVGAGLQSSQCSSAPHITPLESIITTRPLPSERVNASFGAHHDGDEHRGSEPTLTAISTSESATVLSPNRQQNLLTSEFQCPECMKTYSCRKNVKRHRMAVHKLSPEEVSRSTSSTHSMGNNGDGASLPQLAQHLTNRLSSTRNDLKFDSNQQLQSNRYHDKMGRSWINSHQLPEPHVESHWSRSREYLDDEESAETARIAAELKRSVEQEMAEIEGKKPRTELAEADTTFHEETELGCSTSHDPARVPSINTFAGQANSGISAHSSMKSWVDQKSVSLEMTQGARSGSQGGSSNSVRANKRPPHVCVDCNRVLSSDYSLRRHRLTCVEARSNSAAQATAPSGCVNSHSAFAEDSVHLQDVMLDSAYIESDRNTDSIGLSDPMLSHVALSTPLSQQSVHFSRTPSLSGSGTASDGWYERHSLCKTDDVPDSTTSQRLDRSTSPGLLSTSTENSQPGCLQYTRKQTNFGGGSARSEISCQQQHKHLCQACGKFYSSEWNLERHRRESCPVKGKVSPMQDVTESINDEASVQVGHTLFLLSRSALSRASAYFAQLFAMHDPSKGELRLELDPTHFQSLLDVYNNPNNLNQFNIDAVVVLANRLKFSTVFDSCERYIAEQIFQLPQISVMHAIRLAEQLKLSTIKQRLFDTISIDVFRSLASDEQYKKMDAELKAELLEKWGTFL